MANDQGKSQRQLGTPAWLPSSTWTDPSTIWKNQPDSALSNGGSSGLWTMPSILRRRSIHLTAKSGRSFATQTSARRRSLRVCFPLDIDNCANLMLFCIEYHAQRTQSSLVQQAHPRRAPLRCPALDVRRPRTNPIGRTSAAPTRLRATPLAVRRRSAPGAKYHLSRRTNSLPSHREPQ